MEKMKILFFSPFQAIEKHEFPQALFAKSLAEDVEIIYLGCGGLLQRHCISHAAHGLSEEATLEARAAICKLCNINRKQITKEFSQSYILDDFYDESLEPEIQSIVEKITPSIIYSTFYKGYPVGRIAAFEFILDHKIYNIEHITEVQLGFYKIHLANVLRALLSFEKFARTHAYDKMIVYIQAYSINNIVREVSLKLGKPVAFAHPGFNLKHLNNSIYYSWKTTIDNMQNNIQFYVSHEPAIQLDYSKYMLSIDQFKEQIHGTSYFNYSVERKRSLSEICQRLDIGSAYKKVVLLAMSSSDEAYAADFSFKEFQFTAKSVAVFKNQAEWLTTVVDFFKNKPEYKLVIRIHPREFPNQRESVRAPVVEVYEKILDNLPPNIVLDRPEMKNSIYDLFEITDFMLSAQSSVGFDAARLGIPVISCVDGLGIFSTAWLCRLPKNPADYIACVQEFLENDIEASVSTVKKALDWNLFLYTRAVLPFNSGNFWRPLTKLQKISAKLRSLFHLPKFSFPGYARNAVLTAEAKELFKKFIFSGKELIELNSSSGASTKMDDKRYIFLYLKELFELYFDIPIGEFKNYEYIKSMQTVDFIKPNTCYFIIGTDEYLFQKKQLAEGSVQIFLPQKSKVSHTLAKFIHQLNMELYSTVDVNAHLLRRENLLVEGGV